MLNIIIPRYEPYPKISPALVGLLKKKRIDRKDIVATIVDLAIRGYFNFDNQQGKIYKTKAGISNFKYTLTKSNKNTSSLYEYEKTILQELFKNSKNNKIIINMLWEDVLPFEKIKKQIYAESVKQKLFYKNPRSVRERYFKINKIIMTIGWITLIIGIGIFLIIFSLIFSFIIPRLVKKTTKGKEVVNWNKGLKMYIHHAERYRLKRASNKKHSLLAYAIVLNELDNWKKHFQKQDAKAKSILHLIKEVI